MRDQIANELLDWYDANARQMPWRVGPERRATGEMPNPYFIWLSEVMLQQTTVAAVGKYFRYFVDRWPNVHALAAAQDEDVMAAWAGLGYYARARNLLACARKISSEFDGNFPSEYAALLRLPGVGPYTAAAISAIAFDRPETVVDGNVERVMARLHAVAEPLPTSKNHLKVLASRHTPKLRPGDYAQAVMDLGATICTPRSPACGICPIIQKCKAQSNGNQADLPTKVPKAPKPIRLGIIYVGRREDGAWLLEKRPPKGLLGGMLGWPGSSWLETPPDAQEPIKANWQDINAEVRHTFTHFHLRLQIMCATLPVDATSSDFTFVSGKEFAPASLPTLMRKAYDLSQHWHGK